MSEKRFKILYVHDLDEGKDARLSQVLKDYLPTNFDVLCPEVPSLNNNLDKLVALNKIVCDEDPDIIMSSSFGAFLTMSLKSDKTTVLINPAIKASKDIKKLYGYSICKYKVPRENGDIYFTIDDVYIKTLDALENRLTKTDLDTVSRNVYAIFSSQDELFRHQKDFEQLYKTTPIVVKDRHSLSDETLKNIVVPLVIQLSKSLWFAFLFYFFTFFHKIVVF